MAQVTRNFKGKTIEMLTALTILLEIVKANATELLKVFPLWKAPFLDDLATLVKQDVTTYIGVDNLKDQREATDTFNEIQDPALKDLTTFHKRLTRFVKDKVKLEEYLTNLGFNKFYKAAKQSRSHFDLVSLLLQIKQNLNAATRAELVALNIIEDLQTRIIGYADKLKDANITQGTFKVTKSSKTQTAIIELNTTYEKVMDVVVTAADHFKDNKALAKQLSYGGVLATIKGPKKPKIPKPTTPTTPPKSI